MTIRPDCDYFEPKQHPNDCGDCQTDGHFLCKNCKHIALADEMEYSDNVDRFYPELLQGEQPQDHIPTPQDKTDKPENPLLIPSEQF